MGPLHLPDWLAYWAVPLTVLIGLWYVTRFPLRMGLLLVLGGPLVGSSVVVTVGELAKPHPDPTVLVPATLSTYVFGALPLFGLWVVDFGVVGWSLFRKLSWRFIRSKRAKLTTGAVMGAIVGIPLIALFIAVARTDPHFPIGPDVSLLSDPVSVASILLQGVLAGAFCGFIAALYCKEDSAIGPHSMR